MADVFGRQDQIMLGGLSSDSMFVSWPELAAVNGGLGMLIQNIGLEYRQPVRRIFEIGPGVIPTGVGNGAIPANVCETPDPVLDPFAEELCLLRTQPSYYIIGRPEGRLRFGRFVGPSPLGQCFYRAYGNPCGPGTMTISGRAGCSAADALKNPLMTWVLNGVIIEGINEDINGQEMVIQEGVNAQFVGLNVLVNGDPNACAVGAGLSELTS